MRILLTGASSFTGLWFAKALFEAGHEVCASPRRTSAPFGSANFLAYMKEKGPFDLLCHHAAEVKDYRSPTFDVDAAVASNTHNLPAVLELLGEGSVVLTGTVFEPDITPYGRSKGITTQIFREHCPRLHHFVIPNPFGPFEKPRFSAYLMGEWAAGRVAEVRTPAYVRDNIHVQLLAEAYVSHGLYGNYSPSGYVGTMGEFTARYAREMRTRLGWECAFSCAEQTEFPEPLTLIGRDPVSHVEEGKCWDELAEYYASSFVTGRLP